VKLIPLTQGKFAIVDDENFDRLNANKWCAMRDKSTRSFYAVRNSPRVNGKSRLILMHREVVNAEARFDVDHRNHNTIDNRLDNLRVCTTSQNAANSRVRKDNSSGCKGVHWHKQSCKWHARLAVSGKRLHLGYFDSKEDAASAYDAAALELHGEFALTNKAFRKHNP